MQIVGDSIDPDATAGGEEYFQDYVQLLRTGDAPGLEEFLAGLPPDARPATRLKISEFEEIWRTFHQASHALKAGRSFGHYLLVRELGRGGFSTVWEAEDRNLHRQVALKILHLAFSLDDRAEIRLQREAEALARMHHPGILKVYGLYRIEGQLALAVELVEGGQSLLDEISQRAPDALGPFRVRQMAQRFAVVAEALEEAHQSGILHRDIKPSNLLLTKDGGLKLADFGLAMLEGNSDELTRTTESIGTVPYVPPEPLAGRGFSPQTDVWSLGVTLFESLCGSRPFQGQTAHDVRTRILNSEPQWPRSARKLPADLRAICSMALAKNPHDRYASMQAMATDLRNWLDGHPVVARRASLSRQAVAWVRRNVPAVVLVVSVMVVAGVLAALLKQSVQNERRAKESVRIMSQMLTPLDPAALDRSGARMLELADQAHDFANEELVGQPAERARLLKAVGGARMYLEDFAQAEVSYRNSYAIQPDEETLVRIAWCLGQLEKVEEAARILEPIANRPLHGDLHRDSLTLLARNRLGGVELGVGDAKSVENARKRFEDLAQSLQGMPQDLPFLRCLNLLNLATSHYQSRDFELALAGFKKARGAFYDSGLFSHPDVFFTYVGEHHVLKMKGDLDHSVEALLNGLDHRREHHGPFMMNTLRAQLTIARDLFACGRQEEARTLFLDYRSKFPNRIGSYALRQQKDIWTDLAAQLGEPGALPGLTTEP